MAGSVVPPSTLATSTALLAGLADDARQDVWTLFVHRYRPVLVRHACRTGWPVSDAEDIAQQSLLEFVRAYRDGKFDRGKGRLRDWLFGIARNQARNAARRRAAVQREDAEEAEADSRHVFDEEWDRGVLSECLQQVREHVEPATYRAFELFALRGVPAASVAEELRISENAVFQAKRRVLGRLRELVPPVEEVW